MVVGYGGTTVQANNGSNVQACEVKQCPLDFVEAECMVEAYPVSI